MPPVKSLLRKLINEEAYKLQEQEGATVAGTGVEATPFTRAKVKQVAKLFYQALSYRWGTHEETLQRAISTLEDMANPKFTKAVERYWNTKYKDFDADGLRDAIMDDLSGTDENAALEPFKFADRYKDEGKAAIDKVKDQIRAAKDCATLLALYAKQNEKVRRSWFKLPWPRFLAGKHAALKCEQEPFAQAKVKGTAAIGKGAGKGAGEAIGKGGKIPKRKDVLVLQTLLKKRFGKKINLGRTGKNKDGVDGAYGGKTQRAINLLRKTDGGPKRQANFTKSIAALIAHLKKGVAKGPSPSAAAPATTLRGAIPMQAGEQGGGMGTVQEHKRRLKNERLHGRTRRLQEGVAADARRVALFVRRLKGGKCGYDCREAASDLDADAVNRLATKGYIAKVGMGADKQDIINAIEAIRGGKGLRVAHSFLQPAGTVPATRSPAPPAKKREPKIAVTTKEKPSAVASEKAKPKRGINKKTRSHTMLIQRKLNDFADVAGIPGLKPTRRAKDGADGILGKGTIALAKKVLGNIPQLKNKWVARRNAAKINKMLSDKYEKENIVAKVGASPGMAATAPALADRNRKSAAICAKRNKRFDPETNKCV